MTHIFKVSINVDNLEEVNEFLSNMDEYLCLSSLLPYSRLGFCLGVVRFEIEGEIVKLALYMVNDSLKQEWIRLGGIEIDIDTTDFKLQLYNTAASLLSAAVA